MSFAAQRDLGAFSGRLAEQFFDLFHRRHIDQRTLLNTGRHAVADFQSRNGTREFFNEGVIDAVLNQEAIGANAGLTHVAEFRRHRAGHRGIQIGIVKDNERCVSTQLQRYFLYRRSALPHQLFAHLGRAGK